MPRFRIEFHDEYEACIGKEKHTVQERIAILEYLRGSKLFQPEVVMIHASELLQPGSAGQRALSSGDSSASWLGSLFGMVFGGFGASSADLWAVHEQCCMASMQLGLIEWSAHSIKALVAQFPQSKRVRRLYALYRECIGDWPEAVAIYQDILKESPENTFCRKRLLTM